MLMAGGTTDASVKTSKNASKDDKDGKAKKEKNNPGCLSAGIWPIVR
jgi:hypothetical protein